MMKTLLFLAASAIAADAAVIYKNINQAIGRSDPILGELLPRSIDFDFNQDGDIDLVINFRTSGANTRMTIGGADTSQFVYRGGVAPDDPISEFEPLLEGFVIGSILDDPDLNFFPRLEGGTVLSDNGSTNTGTGDPYGAFVNSTNYLGFQFEAADGVHYGYIQLQDEEAARMTVIDYGWETDPGKSIEVGAIPEPSSILLMTTLSLGVFIRRR